MTRTELSVFDALTLRAAGIATEGYEERQPQEIALLMARKRAEFLERQNRENYERALKAERKVRWLAAQVLLLSGLILYVTSR